MQIVIEISEDIYNNMKSRYAYQNETDDNLSVFEKIGIAVKNGIPLPKGHGRIGDIDELMDIIGLKDNEEYREYNYGEVITLEDIDRLNVIIEPDKEASE